MANYKKILKVSAYSVVGVILAGVLGVTAIVTLVNPNRFKPMIIKAAYEATGRKLALDGDISWTIYPNLGLKIQKVSLSNPDGFKAANLVEVNSADVSVALIPLLSHKVIFKNLVIDGLKVGLIEQNGNNNWTFTPPQEKPSEPGKPSEPAPIHIEFSSLSLTNTTISYDDFDHKKHQGVKNVNLKVDTGFGGEVKFDSKEDVLNLDKVAFNYNDAAIGELNLKVLHVDDPDYNGDVKISKLMLNKLLNDFNIDLGAKKGMPILDNISFSGTINGDKNNIKLANFNFNFADLLKGTTNLDVKNFKNPTYNGNINLAEFNLNKVLNQANIAVNERKDKPLLNSFAFSSKINGNMNSANLNGFSVNVGKLLQVSGSVQVNNFVNPNFNGNINVPDFSLNKVLDGLNIAVNERKNKPLLNSFAFNSKFRGSTANLILNNYSFKTGGILQGSGTTFQVQNFADPKFNGDIAVPTFSLNKVMEQLAMAPIDIPKKERLNQVAVKTSFAGSKTSLNLSQLLLKIANTNITGSLNVPSFKPLSLAENITVDQLDVSDFSNVNGFKVPLHQVHFVGNSSLSDGDLATLNGKQSVQIGNVKLLGFSLDEQVKYMDRTISSSNPNGNVIAQIGNAVQINQAINKVKAEIAKATAPGAKDYSKSTDLGTFNSEAVFHNGVANPSNFKLDGPSLSTKGNGELNLAKKSLNYKVSGQLLVSGINPVFKKLTFPATVQGSFKDPSASLDWGSIIQQLVAYAVTNGKNEIKNAISQQVNQAVGSQVRQAIGNQNGNQVIDNVGKAAADAIGGLFGGGK